MTKRSTLDRLTKRLICWITSRHVWKRPKGVPSKWCKRCGLIVAVKQRKPKGAA